MTREIADVPSLRHTAVGNVTKLTDNASGAIDWTYDVLDRHHDPADETKTSLPISSVPQLNPSPRLVQSATER